MIRLWVFILQGILMHPPRETKMGRAIGLGVGVLALAGISLPSSAADLRTPPPARAPVVAPVLLYNWSGFYIGGHIGAVGGDKDWTDVTFAPFPDGSHHVEGFLAGGQAGFNWQAGNWVFGIEGQASWTNADDSHLCLVNFGLTCATEMNWLGSVAGRVGYAFNNVLLYAKGGFAFANEDYIQSVTGTGVVFATAEDETRTGWMVGVGLEYGFTPNWSIKVEYNFMDFGNDTFNLVLPGTGVVSSVEDIDQQLHVVKAGINYRFNWGAPYGARY
jgi:outer membrane immunogenic protein